MSRSYLPAWLRGVVSSCLDDCCLCHAPLASDPLARHPPVCAGCLGWFVRTGADFTDEPLCLQCGSIHKPASQRSPYCHRCIGTPSLFERIVVPFRYQWPVDRLVGQLKYYEKRHLARLFGGLLASEVTRLDASCVDHYLPPAGGAQVLLPVPLHPARLIKRGFNQAGDIAHWCGRSLGLACQPGWVHRIEDTGSLAATGRAERELAIRGAFAVDAAVSGQHVVIVDDVLTTGATTAELARECHDSGAATVALWAVARTVARPAPASVGRVDQQTTRLIG